MQSRFLVFILFVLAIFSTAITTLYATGKMGGEDAAGGAVDKAQVGELVKEYITNNPEEIVQAFMAARAQQEQQASVDSEKTIASKIDVLENEPTSPIYGNADGDVVFVKFNDYNCGFCKRAGADVAKLAAEDGNIKFVVKEFPILGAQSTVLGKAAIAFNLLNADKFEEFHKVLLKATPRTQAQINAAAEKLGVSGDDIEAKMASDEVAEIIRGNLQLGQSIGVSGTPAFVIGGEFVRGAVGLDQMKALVAKARNK